MHMVVVSFGHGCRPIVLPHSCRLHNHNACVVYKCLRMGRGMSQAPKLFPLYFSKLHFPRFFEPGAHFCIFSRLCQTTIFQHSTLTGDTCITRNSFNSFIMFFVARSAFFVLVSLGHISPILSAPVTGNALLASSDLLKNGQDAQNLNAKFATLSASDSCNGELFSSRLLTFLGR